MKIRRNIGFLLCLLFSMVSYNFSSSEQAVEEADVKAAFIINFTKYIEWENPSFANADKFKIGVVGDDAVYKSLKAHTTKKIKDKTIELKYYSTLGQIEECHLFYVSEDLTLKDLKDCSSSDKSKFALVIGDKKNALSNGAGINFVLVGSNLKFEINQNTLSNNKLKASSALLSLAVTVQR